MEDVLDLYGKPYNQKEPVLCFDEKSKQLIKDTRPVRQTQSGKPRRRDYEYQRNGTQNIFVTVEPKGGYRRVTVTEHRKRPDFARELRSIVTLKRYREATTIHVVFDNLNTHNEQSLLQTFGAVATNSLMSRIQFHSTPKHASWLNMAEIEIGILDRQCIKGRIATKGKLKEKVSAWQKERNRRQAKIDWTFTTKKARETFRYEKIK